MIGSHYGEFVSIGTALCWTITALAFESAGKKVGSLAVNFIRLVIGLLFLSVFTFIVNGRLFPTDATKSAWFWLSISGVIGLTFGDLMLFQAFVVIGARISLLIMSIVPIITSVIGWLFLKEILSIQDIIAMFITIGGVAIVILEHNPDNSKVKFSHPTTGVLFAVLGAICQAIGLVFSKKGMGNYNAFAATQIRIISGIIGFVFMFFIFKKWSKVGIALNNKSAMKVITIGSIFGPFLGVSLSLLAIQYTTTGVASTIMSISPILIIPPAIILFKEKVTLKEIIGAFVAVGGVILFFV